jgi:hypothetical protein
MVAGKAGKGSLPTGETMDGPLAMSSVETTNSESKDELISSSIMAFTECKYSVFSEQHIALYDHIYSCASCFEKMKRSRVESSFANIPIKIHGFIGPCWCSSFVSSLYLSIVILVVPILLARISAGHAPCKLSFDWVKFINNARQHNIKREARVFSDETLDWTKHCHDIPSVICFESRPQAIWCTGIQCIILK